MDYDSRTALLVVDVQNDFADPAGGLYVAGAEEIVEGVNQEIEEARGAGALVVYTSDWHPAVTSHFAKDGGEWPVHCVGGTWGAEFHPGLRVHEPADIVRKGVGGEDGYSAFSMRQPTTGERAETGLDDLLRARDIERIVIVGLATDYCVKETVLDGIDKGFGATVLTALVRPVDREPGDGEQALEAMEAAGASVV
jgi:nicotinamidase/pyrazinamidase